MKECNFIFFFSPVGFRPLMKEKLHQGITLVVDRYAFSGVAFTSAKEVSVWGWFVFWGNEMERWKFQLRY